MRLPFRDTASLATSPATSTALPALPRSLPITLTRSLRLPDTSIHFRAHGSRARRHPSPASVEPKARGGARPQQQDPPVRLLPRRRKPALEVTVDSVEEAKFRLVRNGCEIVKDEPDFPRCYIRDPFGLTYNL